MMDLGKCVKLEWNPWISEKIQVKISLKIIEEIIKGVNLQVVELKFDCEG
jgi:hypothetical protein